MNRTVPRGYLVLTVTVGDETFTDLDVADDVSLLASIYMLEVVVLAREYYVRNLVWRSAGPKGKHKLSTVTKPPKVSVHGQNVEAVVFFFCLGS